MRVRVPPFAPRIYEHCKTEGSFSLDIESKEVGQQIELTVQVEAETVDQSFKRALSHLAQRVNVSGFRRGKAPLNLVRAQVGIERVRGEALDFMIDELLPQVWEKTEVHPLFPPQVEVEEFEEGKCGKFKLLVDPWPHFDLPAIEQVKLDFSPPHVGEVDVEEAMERLRESYATYFPKDGPAEMQDAVVLRWRVNEKEPWHTEMLQLGKGTALPGLEEQIMGIRAGEQRSFNLRVKEEDVRFFVEAVEVKRRELPSLDDQFAEKFQAKSLQELREKIEAELKEQVRKDYENKVKEEVLHHYLELISIAFSQHAEEQALESYAESFKENLQRRGSSMTEVLRKLNLSEEEWRETVAKKQALSLLKEQIVLDELAEKKEIELSAQELEQALKERGSDARPRAVAAALRREKALKALVEDWRKTFSQEEKKEGEQCQSPG